MYHPGKCVEEKRIERKKTKGSGDGRIGDFKDKGQREKF